MSLINVSRDAVNRRACLRHSYIEISRFLRTRHCMFTIHRPITCPKNTLRCFASSVAVRENVGVDEKLRKTLDEYKATFRPTMWNKYDTDGAVAALIATVPGVDIDITGYLSTRRDVNKKLAFTMLRSKTLSYCIQLVSTSNTEGEAADAHARIRSLREWTPVTVRGKIKEREPAQKDTFLGMELIPNREIAVEYIEPLNEIPDDIIIKEETAFGPDQRHLQLRTDTALRENIRLRDKTTRRARLTLAAHGWTEIETPILFKSTPEGAREFLVPTRQRGLAYALPQSPQQYKQILMASGFTKYFQLAKCFRDEDLRADRQPEFTQLDMEMSFAGEEDIMAGVEKLLSAIWFKVLNKRIPEPFRRMTYNQAMSSYGSDKPDLRYQAMILNITGYLTADLISKITPLRTPVIDAMKISVSSDPKETRKFVSTFLDSPDGKVYLDNPHGQPGIFIGDLSQPMQGLGPLGYGWVMDGPEELAVEHGDLIILQARPDAPFSDGSTPLGNLRLALYKTAIAQGLMDAPDSHSSKFLWITDFPLFTPNNDTDPGQGGASGFSSTHHPFTAPKTPADVDFLLTNPHLATAAHYDIVLNGIEIGGGSRRIHNAAVQEFVFREVLKMKPERIEDFRHLLDVLRSGCPPHAGIALGWDRICAILCGADSLRDVIAFPKSGRGEDMLVKSPNLLTAEQLDTYHLTLR